MILERILDCIILDCWLILASMCVFGVIIAIEDVKHEQAWNELCKLIHAIRKGNHK